MAINRKKLPAVLLAIILIFAFTACVSSNNSMQASADNMQVNETGNKILVVYYSWSGHLDSMAHWVADETGGDLYRVLPKNPYPDNYNQTADRARAEQNNNERPEIVVDITPDQMSQYDTVFFGFPVWWYDLPMCMWTFLESYDFSGKTIIPFFSHEGSSNGAGALPTVDVWLRVPQSGAAMPCRSGAETWTDPRLTFVHGCRNLAIRNRKIHRLPPEKRSLSIFQDPEIQSESPVLLQTN